MSFDFEAERDIFVIFQDDQSYLCSALFAKGFKHCFAIERQALGWICIDPSRNDFIATILPATYADDIIEPFLDQNPTSTVLQLSVRRAKTDRNTYPRLGLISCVSTIQYMLGVYWPWCITPRQLYCRLSKGHTAHIRLKQIWQAVRKQDEQPMKQQPRHEMKPQHYENRQIT